MFSLILAVAINVIDPQADCTNWRVETTYRRMPGAASDDYRVSRRMVADCPPPPEPVTKSEEWSDRPENGGEFERKISP